MLSRKEKAQLSCRNTSWRDTSCLVVHDPTRRRSSPQGRPRRCNSPLSGGFTLVVPRVHSSYSVTLRSQDVSQVTIVETLGKRVYRSCDPLLWRTGGTFDSVGEEEGKVKTRLVVRTTSSLGTPTTPPVRRSPSGRSE